MIAMLHANAEHADQPYQLYRFERLVQVHARRGEGGRRAQGA